MSMLLLALLGACTCNGGPAVAPVKPLPDGAFPKVDLAKGGVEAPLQLYLDPLRSKGAFTLADSSLPADIDAPKRIEIDLASKRKGRGAVVEMPFQLDPDARARIGTELKVTVGGRELRYASLGGGAGTWRLKGDELVIQAPPAQNKAVLEYQGAASLVKRRILSRSGLGASDFVVHELTVDGITRPGLMLPSPSTVSWDVTLPAKGARFAASASLDAPPFSDQKSDGMAVVLEIDAGGKTTEVSRKRLVRLGFEQWSADLSAWSGQSVTVRLRTEVEGKPDFDYAFLGSPTIWGDPTGEVRRVLVIGMDTTRPDHISWYGYPRETTPQMDAIANQSAVFVDAWTPAPRTRPSFRSATTGRNPLDAVGATNIGEVFQQNGFATAGIVANIHLQPRFDFHEGFDEWQYYAAHDADANQQVDRALAFFERNVERDAYMFLHFMDPHLRYGAPGQYRDMFVDDPDPDLPMVFDRGQVQAWTNRGQIDERRQKHIEALYDGELRFMSTEIGRLVEALDALPGQTLVVFHSDHGEEFWEHGGFEHNHTLYGETTRAVLWFRPPGGTDGGPVRVRYPATLADIGPTLYDFLGFGDLPVTDGVSLRPYMEGRAPDDRDLGIAHLRYGLDQWAVVHAGHKYIVATATGDEQLYDLADDPGENENLAGRVDTAPWKAALAPAHPGMRAAEGWRLKVALPPRSGPMVLTLPSKAADAGIYDPEALLASGRANKAWGEAPRKTPEEVGGVALSEDGLVLTFTPGTKPDGVIWVLFDGAPPRALDTKILLKDTPVGLQESGGNGAKHVGAGGARLEIEPGFVVVPPPDEAARMAVLDGAAPEASDEDTTCHLCQLGYLEGPACDVCKGGSDPGDHEEH